MKKQELVIHCLGASNTRRSICGTDGDRFLYTQEVNYPALLQQKLGCTCLLYTSVAGLMNDERTAEEMSREVAELGRAWEAIGCRMASPFMTMALLSLALSLIHISSWALTIVS